jgi:diguanylate cyclase (GGDEF)-like protein
MRSRRTLRAREPRAAARSAALILIVCSAAVSGLTVVQQSSAGPLVNVISWAVVLVLVTAAVGCYRLPPERLDSVGVLLGTPLCGVLLICCLNMLTHDTSAAAQAFLAFPVLWAASHLRHAAVVLVTGTAVAGNGLTLFALKSVDAALTDLVFFGSVLVVMAVMLLRAGTVQERLVDALQAQATRDSLTGLVNRRVFDEALETTMRRPASTGMALVLIDVDAFKSINDAHGHPVGDDVLVHLAAVLGEQVRAEDAVLSRLGGDELAVLLPGCTSEVAALRAEQLLDAVRSRPLALPDGSNLSLSISVGVAHLPEHSGDLRGLYSAADAALYDAKRAGRGRVAVASSMSGEHALPSAPPFQPLSHD